MSDVPFWGPDFASLQAEDPEIADVLLGELERLRGGLQLIASENFTSPAVLAALGSTLSNKYAEGYPGRRYYGGCAEVDKAEQIGDRPGQAAVRRRAREHAAALRRQREPGRIRRLPGRPVTRCWRCRCRTAAISRTARRSTSPARWFSTVSYGVREDDRAHRLRPGARPGPRAPAQDDHLRCDRVPAAHRLCRVPGDRRRGRRDPHGRRGPLHRPGRRRRDPQPGPVRGRGLLHHAQGPARPARRHDPVPRGARRRRSTRRCSRSSRAVRSCTPSPRRRSR